MCTYGCEATLTEEDLEKAFGRWSDDPKPDDPKPTISERITITIERMATEGVTL